MLFDEKIAAKICPTIEKLIKQNVSFDYENCDWIQLNDFFVPPPPKNASIYTRFVLSNEETAADDCFSPFPEPPKYKIIVRKFDPLTFELVSPRVKFICNEPKPFFFEHEFDTDRVVYVSGLSKKDRLKSLVSCIDDILKAYAISKIFESTTVKHPLCSKPISKFLTCRHTINDEFCWINNTIDISSSGGIHFGPYNIRDIGMFLCECGRPTSKSDYKKACQLDLKNIIKSLDV